MMQHSNGRNQLTINDLVEPVVLPQERKVIKCLLLGGFKQYVNLKKNINSIIRIFCAVFFLQTGKIGCLKKFAFIT